MAIISDPTALIHTMRRLLEEETTAKDNLIIKTNNLAIKQLAQPSTGQIKRQYSVDKALNELTMARQEAVDKADQFAMCTFVYFFWLKGNSEQLAKAIYSTPEQQASLLIRLAKIEELSQKQSANTQFRA